MRNISFSITLESFNNRTKTVTRRLGWSFLKAGDVLMGVEKAQGIKKGELKRLHAIEIVSVRKEPLMSINDQIGECAKEGFPEMETWEFVRMFCEYMKCDAMHPVNRIEFKHL